MLGFVAVVYVTVQVRARQSNDQRRIGPQAVKLLYRRIAFACVQCNEDIGIAAGPIVGHGNTMPEITQESGPAVRGMAVAAARVGAGRHYDCYSHDSNAL